jgi:hypothetical protein
MGAVRRDRRWLMAAVAAALAIVALSFVDGWMVHDRELRGEGYRRVQIALNAWEGPALPVLGVGIVSAALAALMSAAAVRVRAAAPVAAIAAMGTLACVGASVVPIGQDGRASSVDLTVGWASIAGIGLASVMLAGVLLWAGRPTPGAILGLGIAGVLLLAGATGGRWLVLQERERPSTHWSAGTYVREATGEQPQATLIISEGSFEIGSRWRGTWDGSGLTVALDEDPACPDARGAYHVHDAGANGQDLRFVALVDPCRDGARAAELETGIWRRQP